MTPLKPDTARLRLKRLEAALIRTQLQHEGVLPTRDAELVRYALILGRLTAVGDHALPDEVLAPFRDQILVHLTGPLREIPNTPLRLIQVRQQVDRIRVLTQAARLAVLSAVPTLSPSALDQEICHKVLVLIPGGGGGAGYVYAGFVARLLADDVIPAYLIGSSIGALLGGLMARHAPPDIPALMTWGKQLAVRQIFSQPRLGTSLSLPGLVRLHLRGMDQLLRHPDGSPIRLCDTAIPYDAVVGGVKASAAAVLPRFKSGRINSSRLPMRIAERMVLMLSYFSPQVATELVLGGTPETEQLRLVDAIGLSSAIPGVLQYAPWKTDETSLAILAALREQHGLSTFMDGGMVANVPARAAWRAIERGRIGRRNAYYLAMDCFGPQWGVGHSWLYPVTQMIQAQLPRQRPYYDWLVQFDRTPSPVNLLPAEAVMDQAYEAGWAEAERVMPQLKAALKPLQVPDFN